MFIIQSQLPVAAVFTVTVSGLTEDTRKALSLAPLSENVTVYTYDASDWMNGGNCYGIVSIPVENISGDYAITYGTTTVAELRENVKSISTSAIPYYGDSLDAGADAFVYNVAIECKRGGDTCTISCQDYFEFTSPGTSYIDSIYDDDSLDSFVVSEISIEVNAKLFWNSEIKKNQDVSDKIRLADPNMPVIEVVNDPRLVLPLSAVDKYSMTLSAEQDDSWLIGSYAWADYIIPDTEGNTYGKTTIGNLRGAVKRINTTANSYVSDSLGAGEDAFEYKFVIQFPDGDAWWEGTYAELGKSLTQLIDDIQIGAAVCGNAFEQLPIAL